MINKLNTDSIEIQRAHRLGANAIIVNFLNFKDRENILKRKKMMEGSGTHVLEDFPVEIRDTRRKLMNLTDNHRREGKSVYLRYYKVVINGASFMLSADGDNLIPARRERDNSRPRPDDNPGSRE